MTSFADGYRRWRQSTKLSSREQSGNGAAEAANSFKVASPGKNPLLEPWTTPFEMPPFDRIAHRALPAGVRPRLCRPTCKEIAAIAGAGRRRRSPTPSRRWSAPARPRPRRRRCSSTLPAPTPTPDIQAIERGLAPRFAKHSMRIYQDATLFARVDALFKKRKKLG